MKSSIDHLPLSKQRELDRIIDILHEEFEDALNGGTADFKKKGRILKIILFGSHARGDWVDEPHTMKGYRSDYDLLVIVNNKKLTDFADYWAKAEDRFIRDKAIKPQVGFIVHSRRQVNTALIEGQYFFSDIRKDGIVLYELDDDPLPQPKPLDPQSLYRVSQHYFDNRFPTATMMLETSKLQFAKSHPRDEVWRNGAAFSLHQAIEQAYSTLLLTLTNYDPHSHNITFLRSLAEEQDLRLVDAWPRDQRRYQAWFNTLNEAYVKARYSEHYQISEEALVWLGEHTAALHKLVEQLCKDHLAQLAKEAGE